MPKSIVWHKNKNRWLGGPLWRSCELFCVVIFHMIFTGDPLLISPVLVIISSRNAKYVLHSQKCFCQTNCHLPQVYFNFNFFICFFEKRFIIHSDLASRITILVGYNLPDSYLGIPLSICTINITLGDKNIKNYTINCYVYIIIDHTQLEFFQTYLAYCCWCLSVALLLRYFWEG